jgi:hypothetical protein
MNDTNNINDSHNNSILNDIKKMLGIASDYTNFDTDIIIDINSVFMILNQLGVGPKDGFKITGADETWNNYVSDEDNLEAIKSYIHLKVKIMFDPPLNSTVMEAHKQMISEYEWRLNVQSEGGKTDVDL